MLGAVGYKTKKELKGCKGQRLSFIETSLFGAEYPSSGTGSVTIVGPDAYRKRSWFALVHLQEHKIMKVE